MNRKPTTPKKKPKSDAQIVSNAIALLAEFGFVDAGETRQEHVRIPTTRVPVFGGCGGELATFGGRKRVENRERQMRATVGKRTTCLYRWDGRESSDFVNVPTKDVEGIRRALLSRLMTGGGKGRGEETETR